GDSVRGVPARGVRDGDGDLRRGRDGRSNAGTYSRRLDHGYLRLAVDLLYQHPVRDAGPGTDDVVHHRFAAPGESRASGLPWPGPVGGRDRRIADDVGARGAARLVVVRADTISGNRQRG